MLFGRGKCRCPTRRSSSGRISLIVKKFYIKERNNRQAPIYFVACGQMTRTDARKHERPLAGSNVMHEFDSEKSYNARLAELRAAGKLLR